MLSLCLPPSPSVRPEYRGLFADSQLDAASKAGRLELLKSINGQLREWKELLRRFLKSSDDQLGGWCHSQKLRYRQMEQQRGCGECRVAGR